MLAKGKKIYISSTEQGSDRIKLPQFQVTDVRDGITRTKQIEGLK